MLRGQQSIFNSLFSDLPETSTLERPERKGRSEMLVLKRNEALICRYYYHAKLRAAQYHVALEVLESEFFLSKRTIVDILQNNRATLKELHTSRPTVKHFRERFPFMSWTIPVQS